MGLPIAGVVLIILGTVALGLWVFPALPFVHDKVHDHFDLKDEDYSKEESNESKD